jgi:hypothetical protein
VLEGSLRKFGNRIHVTAQLVEAENGKHVWAERYDRDLADIFALQDEITGAVTVAVTPAIADAELRRAMRKQPANLDAWAAYQRGLWHLTKATADDNEVAQRHFEQAIDLDPSFSGDIEASQWPNLRPRRRSKNTASQICSAPLNHWPAGLLPSMVQMPKLAPVSASRFFCAVTMMAH